MTQTPLKTSQPPQLSPKKTNKHHHGDLKNALIQAGIELLEEGGIEALSLRKCAIRAGVSHAAPTHHFNGLEGLTVAIAERGFMIFADYLETALKHGAQDPRGQLKAICYGYAQFGRAHAGILNVIFGKTGMAEFKRAFKAAGDANDPRSRDTNRAYGLLKQTCAPFVSEPQNAWVIEWQVWSLIHGFTLLYVSGELGDPNEALSDSPFEAVLSLLDTLEPQEIV
jgi:AcrR family transcriptional regulator